MIFLYPYFLLLLFVPFVVLLIKHLSRKHTSWANVCDAHLLPFLIIQTENKKNIFYKHLLIATWCLACICMAGPAVLKKDLSTAFVGNGIAVVIDMSPAMNKEASEQMTRKLYDLTTKKNDFSFGLILTDKLAYTALPMTQDKAIFQNIIPTLKEPIMPTVGQNIKAGIKKAEDLLNQSGFKNGQILLITAGVTDNSEVVQAIQQTSHPVYIMGVGTETQKHPVTLPNGQFWGGQTPILVELESLTDISTYNYASLDDSDIEMLLSNSSIDKIERSEQSTEQYQNLGIYGVLLLLPLVALLFRRGVLFLLLICLLTSPCYAGFWWRTEQELYQKQMQGVADFNLGQYEQSQKQFGEVAPFDIEALYNLGTAQAYAGNFQQAIATYEQVLAKNPNHTDAAYNLEYLKKQMPPQEQQSSSKQQNSDQQQNEDKNENSDNSDSENQDQSDENQENDSSSDSNSSDNQNNDDSQNSEQQSNDFSQNENTSEEEKEEQSNSNQTDKNTEQNQSSQSQTDKQQSPETDKTETQEQTTIAAQASDDPNAQQAAPKPVSLQDQKQKEWLDQIKPDAGRVLRYRLFRQYQEQQ